MRRAGPCEQCGRSGSAPALTLVPLGRPYALVYSFIPDGRSPSGRIGGATNPLLDDHLINAVLLIAMCLLGADRCVGLGSQWRRTVKDSPFLI